MSDSTLWDRFPHKRTFAAVFAAGALFVFLALFLHIGMGSTLVVSFTPPGPCVAHVQLRPFTHVVAHCD